MEEQYITFKVAQLAKEKGFNILVNNAYDLKGEFGNYYDIVNESPFDYEDDHIDYDSLRYSAPTQALLQKWLREVHKIYVDVDIDQTTAPKFCYMISRFIGNPTDLAAEEWDWQNYPNGVDWGLHRTWEDALEEGLFEALKLI
jgi:hypothetical protein